MKYDKLVRDNIPEILKQKGLVPIIHRANDVEYKERLKYKLMEEVNEFLVSDDRRELADILEVIYAISDFEKMGTDELENIRKDKLNERGKFSNRIIFDEVKD